VSKKDEAFTPKYVPILERLPKVPALPTERPPTRREVWEHYHGIYFDFKGHSRSPLCTPRCLHNETRELESYCRDAWAWGYIQRFVSGMKGWDKQPDWVEGDPVIPAAVPDVSAFLSGDWASCLRTVKECFQTAQMMRERTAA
jgi:hypothetical protein